MKRRPSPRSPRLAEDAAEYRAAQPLRFIDLFCGIGGFRIAFEKIGGRCVFSSDYDKFSQQTYEANFGERPHGDIHTVAVADIPAHDILCAGFPCQPFSIAGVSKKLSLGRKHGFEDLKQGNLFFSIAEILNVHKPAAFSWSVAFEDHIAVIAKKLRMRFQHWIGGNMRMSVCV